MSFCLYRWRRLGWGDPDDDDAGDRPKLARTIPLPPHLAEHDRRPSKVDVEVRIMTPSLISTDYAPNHCD